MRTFRSSFVLLGLAAAALLSSCASAPEAAAPEVTSEAPANDTGAAGATQSPEEAYRAWLVASREPDAKLACSMMSEQLVERMLAEMAASFGTAPGSCEEMVTVTAAAYAATGTDAEVEVSVVSESENEATLFSTYVSSGKCGTIVLERSADTWVINEQSEECAAG